MQLDFQPPGPTGARFMQSTLPVNFIMGPVGSGKTSCSVMKVMRRAASQVPSKVNGVRYTKCAVIRGTYRQLYSTTIPSWFNWVPKSMGQWKGGGNEPGQHHVRFRMQDQTIVDLQMIFAALGDQNIEDLARGWELNMALLNEADTLPPDVLFYLITRVSQGRYPGARHVDPELCVKEIMGDYNAPDIENYLYKAMEEDRPDNWGFFRQPGGLDHNAENRLHVPRSTYEEMEKSLMAQGRDDLVRRMIHNLYGYTRDGKPVYPQYRDDFHCSDSELMPVEGIPVKVSVDQGLRPAMVFRQIMPNGQRRVLDEIRVEEGAAVLAEQATRLIGGKYHGHKVIGGGADPAAVARSGNDAEAWLDCLNRLMNFTGPARIRPVDTNDPEKRQTAVRLLLTKTLDNGQPALLISPTCRLLRKGFNSAYKFKKVRGAGADAYRDVPDKNDPSADVHDALQYDCLSDGGFESVVGRAARSKTFGSGKPMKAKVQVNIR